MLFAVLTEAAPRDLSIATYLETVDRGHRYLQELSESGRLKHAFVRAGMAAGIWLIEADSPEELDALIQRNPTAPYAYYQKIALATPGSLCFSETMTIQAPAEFVYGLLWEVERWPTVLPHVRRVTLREQTPSYQDFELEAEGPSGTRVCRAVRRGDESRRIDYEQVHSLPLFRSHQGAWRLDSEGDAVVVTAEHTLEMEPDPVEPPPGRASIRREAHLLARHLLGQETRSTLRAVKELAERQQSLVWMGDSA
ncbi:muconolactone Delta-isomerase family protein [Pyxidicoccus trucidator]|uniref:muconolactone Delta-isomerase family protein n=1 Tax=Pyxidicoccus trucidator TaxID=2709662 RepID=UPI0013D9AD7F|nr:muconolactone Delta-isomerase family protein [Pyxidicoccus trucidator]